MIALIILFVSAYGIGKIALSRLRLPGLSIMEEFVVSIGAGLGLWCFALFALGHAGLLYPGLLLGGGIAGAIPGLFYLIRMIRKRPWKGGRLTLIPDFQGYSFGYSRDCTTYLHQLLLPHHGGT